MAGDTMKKVQAGDKLKIPAETFNTFIDTARGFRAAQQNVRRQLQPEFHDTDIVLVHNDSEADRQRFDILGIDSVIFTPTDNLKGFQNRPALAGIVPDIDYHIGKFVILLEPAANGKIVRAAIGGFCVARIEVASGEEWYGYADMYDMDAEKLKVAPHGAAQILWRETGTGTKWAVVRLGAPQGETSYWGKLDGSLSANGSATVSIYWKYPLVDSGNNVTAYAPPLLTSGTISSDKWVEVTYRPDAQKWYVTGAQC